MKRTRTFRLAVALAFILNLAGSPMAWSQWLGAHQGGTPAADMAPDCHGHDTSSANDTQQPPPCCDGNGCSCAAPAMLCLNISLPPRIPHPSFNGSLDASPPPALLPDRELRPPIH